MAYPATGETYQTLNFDIVSNQRALQALLNRMGSEATVPSSVAAQTGAGTTGTTTVSSGSSDFRGQITVTPGGTGIAAGAQAIITPSAMPTGWSATKSVVLLVPLLVAVQTDGVLPYVTLQATTWTLNFQVAPTTAHIYTLGYVLFS